MYKYSDNDEIITPSADTERLVTVQHCQWPDALLSNYIREMFTNDAINDNIMMSQNMARQDYNSIDPPNDEIHTRRSEVSGNGTECTDNEQMWV